MLPSPLNREARPPGLWYFGATGAFTSEDLLAGAKTSIIIHEKADNFANIPAERYQQTNGTPPPDQTTLATGDAGKRVACGVIGTG